MLIGQLQKVISVVQQGVVFFAGPRRKEFHALKDCQAVDPIGDAPLNAFRNNAGIGMNLGYNGGDFRHPSGNGSLWQVARDGLDTHFLGSIKLDRVRFLFARRRASQSARA